jgi:spermidine synthase
MSTLFRPMVEVLPPLSHGIAKVEHFEVSEAESRWSYMRRDGVPAGKYARLYVGGTLMMSDTQMEHSTNYRVVRHATGDVLIAGLGLGMILLPIIAKSCVTSVTVVEKHLDVVEAVGRALFPVMGINACKLNICHGDIMDWRPAKGVKFDCIYFDIWPHKCTGNLPQMAKLHQAFKGRLKGNRWMDSWCRDELKAFKRREDKDNWRWNR